MGPNAKKYIVISLIVLVGGALLIGPLMRGTPDAPTPNPGPFYPPQAPPPAAQFTFKENLAAITGRSQTIEI